MCENLGVKLVYLPPYSPDLNPVGELFAELKSFIRRNWDRYLADPIKNLMPSLHGALMWLVKNREC